MTYTLQEQYNSKNFTPAAQVPAVFGEPRVVTSITIHHWGNNGQQFDIVRDFLCTNTTPTSAHYVAMDGLVACIVNTEDAAWHAGNAHGNATSIGIECRPEATDGDYATVGELIASIRAVYGDLPLFPHNYWTSTACPGDYDLTRLDALARGVSPQSGTITPITPIQEADVVTQDDITAITNAVEQRIFGHLIANHEVAGAAPDTFENAVGWLENRIATHLNAVAGGLVPIAQAVGELKNRPTVAAPAIDVPALAAQIAAALNTNQAHQLLVELGNALPKA